mgnify:CR=1 FL=1
MNRMDEYTALLAELEQTPEELDNTVNKALNRKNALQKKRRFLGTSLGGLAACFATFVLLVNLSTPFARACGRIPLLADLAELPKVPHGGNPFDQDIPLGGHLQQVDAAHQRGFTRAGHADDAVNGAIRDGQADVLQRIHCAVLHLEGLGKVFDLDHRNCSLLLNKLLQSNPYGFASSLIEGA